MSGSSRTKYLVGVTAGALLAGGVSAEATEFKLGHVYETGHPIHTAAVAAAESFAACTEGAHTIAVFPASQLGKETALNERIQFGGVDMILTGQIFASGAYPALAIGAAPYIFRDRDHALAYRTSDVFKDLMAGTARITDELFAFARSLVGHLRGGLGHVNILASLIFSGMSGTAVADAGGLGTVEIKALRDQGYEPRFAVGITAASSTIGPIIPPSLSMIVYGVVANESIGRLFAAGIVPGVLMALSLHAMVWYFAVRHDFPREARAGPARILATFRSSFAALLAPLIIVGGILTSRMKGAAPSASGRPTIPSPRRSSISACSTMWARGRLPAHQPGRRGDRRDAHRLLHGQGGLPRPHPYPRPRRHRRRRHGCAISRRSSASGSSGSRRFPSSSPMARARRCAPPPLSSDCIEWSP